MATEEEEVAAEVEALQAVYGDDCLVLDSYPPHLHLHIMPRTADVTSEQFVEAVIAIRASSQYPKEPPQIELIDSKGLDDERKKLLMTCIRDKAVELSSCLMLVALCEEAVDKLSQMNHPDGDCPLCLYPLVQEDEQKKILRFMKLMSCFHCFHCECIIRWWDWLQTEQKSNPIDSLSSTVHSVRTNEKKKDGGAEDSIGNCPVCRKVFHTKDFEHVLDLVGSLPFQLSSAENEMEDSEKLRHSHQENIRRQRFEATFKLQQENCGLIEPKKEVRVLPGMFLPLPVTPPTSAETEESHEQQQEGDPPVASEMHTGASSQMPNTTEHRNRGMRKQRAQHNSRRPGKRWVRRENGSA
ncbi:Cdk-activating kinase assembly factor [Parasponia andersonii]|uniref:Cdk-activating kinase assembly factor n=1 Tax=Parasponia andersonii TaxID=3476 RepID=A0A2P5CCQ0_PARAD|nr:Cdk-activating kinase assembly factor [Parasponia andersonii]